MNLESVPSLFSCLSLEIGEVSVICNLGAKTRMLFNTTATRKVVYIIGQKQSVFRWKNISLRIKNSFHFDRKFRGWQKNLSTTSKNCHQHIPFSKSMKSKTVRLLSHTTHFDFVSAWFGLYLSRIILATSKKINLTLDKNR